MIRSAFNLYWEHGVEHVPLTRVAEEAGVNRVSIYHEFGGEENLLLESLRFYKRAFQSRVKKIDEEADLPAVIHVMFKSVIFDGTLDWSKPQVALFKNDSNSIKREPKHFGCFYLQTKLVRNLLCASHSHYFDRFDSELVRRLTRCIDAAREKGKVFSHLDPKKISEFLVLQLGLFQTLRKSNCSERKMLDAFSFVESLVIPKKYRL